MELPFLSIGCGRQGPTRSAIKRPKTIHLVRTYCTKVLIPAYLNIKAIFDSSYFYMNFRAAHRFDGHAMLQPANFTR